MSEQYVGVDLKKCGYFSGLVVGTAAVVTVIYWGIFGFDTWQEEMRQGADLLMAASVAPVVPVAPVAQPTRSFRSAGQYVCPRDGVVGLPVIDAGGVPHCPVCGQVMSFYTASPNSMTLAAGAG
ncbi:MAG: hypothetical protein JRJ51_08225 [Deltaproteobacteria bacterium]|nr:hypothetical protein [Deltaproteobacteria bacterium]